MMQGIANQVRFSGAGVYVEEGRWLEWSVDGSNTIGPYLYDRVPLIGP